MSKKEPNKSPPLPKRILVSEFPKSQDGGPSQPDRRLGLADVIYENLEGEEREHHNAPAVNAPNGKSQSPNSDLITNTPPTSTSLPSKHNSKLSTGKGSSRNVSKNKPSVKSKPDANKSSKSHTFFGKGKGRKVLPSHSKKSESSPRLKSRRESGIFLLSESSDSLSGTGVSRTTSVTPSTSSASSSTSGVSSSSVHSIGSKTIISPEEVWLSGVESRLVTEGGDKGTLTLSQFKEVLQVKESFFVDRCFQLFDKNAEGEINVQVIIDELRALVFGSQTDKIRFLFNVYNIRGTGKIVKSEIQQVLKSCIEESRLQFSSENLQALTDAFVTAADQNRDGRITFEELRALVERHPTIAENLAVSTLHDDVTKKRKCCRHFTKTYIQNNLKKIAFLVMFMVVNIGLCAFNAVRYYKENGWIIVARCCGICLDFNCSFVLVLTLRRVLTALRATFLVKVLPFDQALMFHKLCGYTIAVLSLVHSIAHIGNAYVISNGLRFSVAEIVFTTKAKMGWIAGTAPITGVVLCVVLTIMVVLSLPFVRRSGYFEVFYWSHKLYLVMWVMLIIHAEHFWKWFIAPGVVFILESVSRWAWVRTFSRGRTYIERVCLLPSEVTQLIISKPEGFTFKPGDYIFIQVPCIARYEWHPFTISSAPEEEGYLWLHIRTSGYWTRSLHEYFVNYQEQDIEATGGEGSGSGSEVRQCNLRRRASSIAWYKQKSLKARKIDATIRRRVISKNVRVLCHIDGPYGTPSRHIFESEHAVLIGSGIGITPFASILQSIVHHFKTSCVKCPNCEYSWCNRMPDSVMNLKKVDFIWINRNQRHFEWFASLLSRLEREQEKKGGLGHILDMQMFMTSAPPKTDMKGLGLQLALDIVHENEKTDLITGLQTRTQAGRPDFDVVFRRIKDQAKGHVTVFFCGSPLVGKTLKHYSHQYGFSFRHEYF